MAGCESKDCKHTPKGQLALADTVIMTRTRQLQGHQPHALLSECKAACLAAMPEIKRSRHLLMLSRLPGDHALTLKDARYPFMHPGMSTCPAQEEAAQTAQESLASCKDVLMARQALRISCSKVVC